MKVCSGGSGHTFAKVYDRRWWWPRRRVWLLCWGCDLKVGPEYGDIEIPEVDVWPASWVGGPISSWEPQADTGSTQRSFIVRVWAARGGPGSRGVHSRTIA